MAEGICMALDSSPVYHRVNTFKQTAHLHYFLHFWEKPLYVGPSCELAELTAAPHLKPLTGQLLKGSK